MAKQITVSKYRILRPSDLVRYGDERWDFELGWMKVKDSHLERFSREYRRAGSQSWRFRRPLAGKQRFKPTGAAQKGEKVIRAGLRGKSGAERQETQGNG